MKNYEQMLIQDQLTSATKKVQDFQQYMNDAKEMTKVMTQSISSQYVQNALARTLSQDEMAALQSGNSGSITQERWREIQGVNQNATTAANQIAAAMTSVTDSIFQQASKVQLAKLQAQQSSLDLQNEALKTQLSTMKNEYDEVKSNEEAAAKSCAPQFGITS